MCYTKTKSPKATTASTPANNTSALMENTTPNKIGFYKSDIINLTAVDQVEVNKELKKTLLAPTSLKIILGYKLQQVRSLKKVSVP